MGTGTAIKIGVLLLGVKTTLGVAAAGWMLYRRYVREADELQPPWVRRKR